MSTEVQTLDGFLGQLEKPFDDANTFGMAFKNECLFAKQQIIKNDFTLKTASNNQGSLKSAILNVAAIGITLNPAAAHAYLVPRDGAICLDISYRGLVKLATDSGAIEWAKAVLVYEGDDFKWRGVNKEPHHEADVLDPSRMDAQNPLENLKGGYCIAKLPDGTFLTDFMTADEIKAVRDTSKAKNGPWKGKWAGEMAKKTLVKRASKSWPQSNGRDRLDTAIEVLNVHEGLEEKEVVDVAEFIRPSKEQTEKFLELSKAGDNLAFCVWYDALPVEVRQGLPDIEYPKGEKMRMRAFFDQQLSEGREELDGLAITLQSACESMDEVAVAEVVEGMDLNVLGALTDQLNAEHARFVSEAIEGQAA